MQKNISILTPDNLQLICLIAEMGSFAGAARRLNLAPSALTYRVRQIEESLDALLFDRSHRLAKPTPAGQTLIAESAHLMAQFDVIARQVKRVATGWEAALTIAVDTVIATPAIMQLCQAFLELNPTTRLKIRAEALSGTVQALQDGTADIAIGIPEEAIFLGKNIQHEVLGSLNFIFAVASDHPLARHVGKITASEINAYRFVSVADSAQNGQDISIAIGPGQDVFSVPDMASKLIAQCMGLGVGYLPEPMVRPYIERGQLVECDVEKPRDRGQIRYGWRLSNPSEKRPGKAMAWWLTQLSQQRTRDRLLGF